MNTGKNKYYRRSRISAKDFRRLIRAFAMDLTATDAAALTGLNVRSVNAIYLKVRRRITEHCEAQNPFGGKWKSTSPTSAPSVYAASVAD